MTFRQAVDLLGGAVDAHLHPQALGAGPRPWTHRLPGLLAIGAGVIWTSFYVRLLSLAPDEEWGGSIGLAILLMFVAIPGDYLAPYVRRIGLTMVAIATCIVLAQALPRGMAGWSLNLIAGMTASLLVGAGMISLLAIRAGVGPLGRWLLLVVVLLIPATIAIPVLGGFGPGDRGGVVAMLAALLPYGTAWTILGLRMSVRGSETIRDTTPPREAEAPAT